MFESASEVAHYSNPSNSMDVSLCPLAFKLRCTPKGACLSDIHKALYTVSVGCVGKSLEEIANAFRWASRAFPICTILVGDGLFRITLEITEGLEKSAAAAKARLAGTQTLCSIIDILGRDAGALRTSDLMETAEFRECLERIRQAQQRTRIFAASIDADAHLYVDRQARRNTLRVNGDRAFTLARTYIEEEIAVYLQLAEGGWLVDAYLGRELPTLARIIEGQIPNMPPALQSRISLSLTSKKRTKKVQS